MRIKYPVFGAGHPFTLPHERTYGKHQACFTSLTTFCRSFMECMGSPSRGGEHPCIRKGVIQFPRDNEAGARAPSSRCALFTWSCPHHTILGFFWLARREREDRTYARLVKAAVGVTGGQKGHRGSDPPAKFSSLDLNRSDLNLTLTSWGGSGDKRVYGRNILKRSPGLLDQPQLSTAHSSRPDKDGQLDGVERHQ